jgi:hypothetical protein
MPCLLDKFQKNMKKLWASTLLIAIAILSYGQQIENRNVGSFSGVKAAEGIDVYLKKGDKEALRLEVTGASPSDVITEISGSYLKIHMKDVNIRNRNVKVYVTYVDINKLAASSAANIYAEGTVKGDGIEISASSAGSVEITVDANRMEVSASSAGEIDLKGKTTSLNADASSAGEIDAYDVEAENVSAEASSGAEIKVNVTKELDAHASSGGSVRYRGNPAKSTTDSSSGGSVKKSN